MTWEPGSGLTTRERIVIEIDPDTEEFCVEFFGGDVNRAYNVLRQIATMIEDGSIFQTGQVTLTESN